MENDMNKVGIFVYAFIAILLGIILLSTLADQVWQNTDGIYTKTNEVITLSNATGVNLANDWVVASGLTVVAEHSGNATGNKTLTVTTQYIVRNAATDDIAQIMLVDNGAINYTGNTSYINYTYQDNNYVRDGTSRILISLVVLFFVLAILATGIWAMNKMGLMEFMK